MDMPPSLLSRLQSDARAAASDLASSSLPVATTSVRSAASRKLLSLTLDAVDTLGDCLSPNSSPKERIAAASAILSRSPATAQELAPSDHTLSASLGSSLVSALSSMASAFSALASRSEPSLVPASEPSALIIPTIPKEVPVRSDPLPVANLPEADPSLELSSAPPVRRSSLSKETPMSKCAPGSKKSSSSKSSSKKGSKK